jgi:hypothetical protein
MKTPYLIILMAVAFALIFTGPVSAYAISVNSPSGQSDRWTRPQVSGNGIDTTNSRFLGSTDTPLASRTDSTGSQGSVSAFSRGTYQDQSTVIEFSQSVSVDGIIERFSYSAHYDSGMFR